MFLLPICPDYPGFLISGLPIVPVSPDKRGYTEFDVFAEPIIRKRGIIFIGGPIFFFFEGGKIMSI